MTEEQKAEYLISTIQNVIDKEEGKISNYLIRQLAVIVCNEVLKEQDFQRIREEYPSFTELSWAVVKAKCIMYKPK
jgi:hypothetical protein